MRDGFVRVAAGTPNIALCDPTENAREAIGLMREADAARVKLLVLPELCMTGASCGDLFLQPPLLDAAMAALRAVAEASRALDVMAVVGLPVRLRGAVYNCAAVVKGGQVDLVPKTGLTRAEQRWFAEGRAAQDWDCSDPMVRSFGPGIVLCCEDMPSLRVAVAVGGPPSGSTSATVVACPAAHPEVAGGPERLRLQLAASSQRQVAGYVVACAGPGESTTDMAYSGRRMIYENGALVLESAPFEPGLLVTELDVGFLDARKARDGAPAYRGGALWFSVRPDEPELTRDISPSPFAPRDAAALRDRCEQILAIQVEALFQRMRSIRCQVALLGVSGGLDSTLAMIVAARALSRLGLPSTNLHAITMPCFGTTDRTKGNAYKLAEALGSSLREISIAQSVSAHFRDIGHDMDTHDAAFENAQARERTQLLMDLANMENGLVVGTGDLSELALGWATYNGDHMSMYAVNGGVPKTLIRHIVRHVADTAEDPMLRDCLADILDTPVSPELLPPKDGQIAQKTEELVGPYELHDFFLYHMVRRMAAPRKIRRLALRAFEGVYDGATIDKWLQTFLRRFFAQQFKRSCMPDGPMVGSLTLSPRGGFVMPSDASGTTWTDTLP